MTWFEQRESEGNLESALRDLLVKRPKQLLKKLKELKTESMREDYLLKNHFSVASEVITGVARFKLREDCKKLRSDCKLYTRYIVGYLLPWLKNEEKQGTLIHGKYDCFN